MKNSIFVLFFLGISCSQGVVGEDEQLVKKGVYPYMAFIYYSDPLVLDATGARFVRSAVLIRTDWLVTSALGPSIIDNGFPEKTLLARVGALTVDVNFTLNEDDDEQEREVIQIVRPYNHSATQWWTTDISLVKTLLPFHITPAVDTKTINLKREFVEKTCTILIYAKYANRTTEKALMQLFVEVLPPTMNSCGKHFSGGTMICASGSNDNKETPEPDFCQGNSGGPLICEGEIMGLQTYIGNNCQVPHLYQLLSSWDNFITCGIEDKCAEELCANICDVTYKDMPKTSPALDIAIGLSEKATEIIIPSPTSLSTISTVSETVTQDADLNMTPTVLVTADEREIGTETTATSTKSPTTLTPSYTETTETAPWPKLKTEETKQFDQVPEEDRKASVQAQQEGNEKRSAAARNMCFVQTVFFGLVLKCLF